MKLSQIRDKYVADTGADESKLVSIVDGFAIAAGADIEVDESNQEVTFIQRGALPDADELEKLMVSRHTPKVHEQVKRGYVAICGLGGLGSNIAVALARLGVGHLKLIDFDVVEPSNLNRQMYFVSHLGLKKTEALKDLIAQINPYIQVSTVDARITAQNAEDLLQDVDIICEAFDNPAAKAELATAFRTTKELRDKQYVGASGLAGHGSANAILTRKVSDGFYIAGDAVTGAKVGRGLMSPRVMVAAGHQANMILRLLLGENDV